jgi:DNA-binding transcriptional regulator YhcF (GntR family)
MKLNFKGEGTKVQQLTDFIQESIALNNLKAGDALPSINELSKEFAVSRDTVFKSFSDLKTRGIIDSVQGKNYFVASRTKNIFLLLDEYSPFKEVLYNTLIQTLPISYTIDLWFHQYNEHLFNKIISESLGKYNKYLVMNYDNESFSDILHKIDEKKLLLLDFGNFEKSGYSYVCQDFERGLYETLSSIKDELFKYEKLVFVLNRRHKHPQISKLAFINFCLDNNYEFRVLDEISDKTDIQNRHFYLVVKNEDVVEIIRQARHKKMNLGTDFGLLAYNENPFYEIIENGISSIGIDWEKMGEMAAQYILTEESVQTYLPTNITLRPSF